MDATTITATRDDLKALRALLDRPLTDLMQSLSIDTINELSSLYHRIENALNNRET